MKFVKEVCEDFGVRMHKGQKKSFRNFVQEKAGEMGYESKIEKSLFAKNVVVGNPDEAEVIFTAHYDTPPRLPKFFVKHMLLHSFVTLPLLIFSLGKIMDILYKFELYDAMIVYSNCFLTALPILSCAFVGYLFGFLGGANKTNFNDNSSGCLAMLNIMDRYKNLPQNLKNKVAFVFTDNEEKMLLGAFAHRRKHKNYKEKTFINLDCVGRGKNFNLYHFGKPTKIVEEFSKVLSQTTGFQATAKKSNFMSMSDHYPFRKANHVCLLSTEIGNDKSLFSQIHSSNDNIIEEDNIEAVVNFVSKLENFALLENELKQSQEKSQVYELEEEKKHLLFKKKTLKKGLIDSKNHDKENILST